MLKFVRKFEQITLTILMIMLSLVVLLSLFDLAGLLWKSIMGAPMMLLEVQQLLDIFGMFLVVLIGVELLETLRIYVTHRELRGETILLVAIIAISHNIITMEVKELPGISILGMAALTLALGWAYYNLRRVHAEQGAPENQED